MLTYSTVLIVGNSSLVTYLKLIQRNHGFWFPDPWVLPCCLVSCVIYEIAVKTLNSQTQVHVCVSCLCSNPPSYIFDLLGLESGMCRVCTPLHKLRNV